MSYLQCAKWPEFSITLTDAPEPELLAKVDHPDEVLLWLTSHMDKKDRVSITEWCLEADERMYAVSGSTWLDYFAVEDRRWRLR